MDGDLNFCLDQDFGDWGIDGIFDNEVDCSSVLRSCLDLDLTDLKIDRIFQDQEDFTSVLHTSYL